ncbi:MAG: LrgB family protein [Gammaproteobacteria bacterium]
MNEWLKVLVAFPLFGVVLTILAFYIGQRLYVRLGKRAYLQPVVAGMLIVIAVLLLCGISYQDYYTSSNPLNLMLGPATVALAVPLYQNARRIRALFLPILLTLLVGSVVTVGIAVGIMWLFATDKTSLISMTTKSITTPIAMSVSEKLGGLASLSAVLVMFTGALGAVVGIPIMQRMGVRDPAVKGIALGLTAHAIGTARALEESEECGAFSALAMGITGVLTAVLLPVLFALL